MEETLNKSELARSLGIARSSLYYRPKKPKEDERIKHQILIVMEQHPCYGHKRIALELGYNKKRIRRIMKKFGLVPKKIRTKKPEKVGDKGNPASITPNIAKALCPIRPNVLWVGDFTYLAWGNAFIYLATVLDVYTREIVGWHIGLKHTTDLVREAFLDAIRRTEKVPQIFHSDQGSEYISGEYGTLLYALNVTPSHSKKSSPWENGYQESFYSQFKFELGSTTQYDDIGTLCEAIHQQMNYYNTKRIHTSVKMPPALFRKKYAVKNKKMALTASELIY